MLTYSDTTFAKTPDPLLFGTAADYRDDYLMGLIKKEHGAVIWPPIRFSYNTQVSKPPSPFPSKPTWMLTQKDCEFAATHGFAKCGDLEYNWLGTDDGGRDVLARLIYGFRISVLFGLVLTIISSIIGIAAGAVQGYFGGWVDLLFQRFIEIWTSIPSLYLLLIISSVLVPGFFVLLGILLLFSWVSLVGLVRAEFLRGRNFEYIMAARALGVSNAVIIFRHLLPNAMVATMTFLPFILSSSVMTLTALDFLGFGLPPGSPSLGELLSQGKANVQAPWLGLTGFFSIAIMLSLLIFIGEAVRDAFDPQKDLPMNAPADTILSIRDLSIAFGTGKREVLAVDRVSFDIVRGETMALVGESGSGKSVTALSVMKLLPYPAAHHPSGTVTFEGRELLTMPENEIRHVRGNDIAIIFQEPMTSLNPLHTIEKQIREILMIHQGLTGEKARARILELLEQVGIPDPKGRLGSYPHQLSGGQRQRVMIAMALANEPDLLIADEPTTALDVTVQAQILKLLRDIQKRLGMSMLFITHDLGIVRKLADRVCVMNQGKIVERGPVERVFTAPEHPYTRALLAAEPKPDPAPPRPQAPIVVRTENLKVWFPVKRGVLRKVVGHIKAVDGISVEVRKGETLGVVGESGSGKTTLGLAILRLISSDGPIVFMGDTIQGLKFKECGRYRRNMQIVFQDPYGSLSPRMSVSDIIEEGLKVHHPHLKANERKQRVVEALTDSGLDPETRFRYPHEFSGGQRQRIALARALVLEPTFIMLDEPTSALDMLIQAQMVDLLRDLQKRHDLTYMFISHDLRVVAALASRLLVLRHGKMVEEGAAADLFKAPKSDYTRALFAAAFKMESAPEGVVAE